MDPWIDVNLEGSNNMPSAGANGWISGQGSAWKEAENESPTTPKIVVGFLWGLGIFKPEGDMEGNLNDTN